MTERERLVATAEAILRRCEAMRGEMAITRGAIGHTTEMFGHMCTLADLTAERLLEHDPADSAAGLVTYLERRTS